MLVLRLLLVLVAAWPVLSRTVPLPNFKRPPQKPTVFTATASSIRRDSWRLINNTLALYDSVVANVQPENATFANVVEPIHVGVGENQGSILAFYRYVSPDAAVRAASSQASKLLSAFEAYMTSHEEYYQLVKTVQESASKEELDEEQRRILGFTHRAFLLNGLALPDETHRHAVHDAAAYRRDIQLMRSALHNLSITAEKNLFEEDGGVWFSPKQLEGIPVEILNLYELEKGSDKHEGKLRVTFETEISRLIMRHASDEATRREYHIARVNKDEVNVPILRDIVTLRDSLARKLGYANHASMRLQSTMAKTPTVVNDFLDDIRKRIKPLSSKIQSQLLESKKSDYKERNLAFDGKLYDWDGAYYSHYAQASTAQKANDEDASQYFPMDSTLDRILTLMGRLFGLIFVELDAKDRARLSPTRKAEDLLWHEDVKMYAVWDDEAAGHGFSGYFYLDAYRRENKFNHAAEYSLVSGFLRKDGSRNYPAAAVVCNVGEKPASKQLLLEHRSVVMLMHELGHAIHDLVIRTRYPNGNMAMDFIEAPSQMLENWGWLPSVIKSLSRHWKTEKPMPDHVIDKIVASRSGKVVASTVSQLTTSIFDMTIHSPLSREVARNLELTKLWNDLQRDIGDSHVPKGVDTNWNKQYAGISHFYGGYDAGLYSYLWTLVYSDDMFRSVFAENPMNGDEGRRFRKTVLEPGGSVDSMKLLEKFLGRKPNTEAFYKRLGLEAKEP